MRHAAQTRRLHSLLKERQAGSDMAAPAEIQNGKQRRRRNVRFAEAGR